MGDIKNLRHGEAIKKIKELVDDTPTCMFTTRLSKAPLNSRPMHTRTVDDEGYLWFFSATDSDKNEDIREDNRVQLFYSNPGKSEFLSLYGTAHITQNRAKIEDLWTAMNKAWFDGKDDPRVSLIRVRPEEAYYWDTKNNKVISMLKIAASAVTGNTMDDAVQGKLEV